MKHYYAIFLFCLLAGNGYGQSPTTFKEAFNFQVGDTLQYHFRKQVDDAFDSYSEGYLLFVVTGVTQGATVTYQTERHIHYTAASNWLAYPPFTEDPPFQYSAADSNVWVLNGLTVIDSGCSNSYDIVFTNQDYEGRVQNEIVRSCFEHSWMRRYIAGLGQTDGSSFQSLGSPFWQGVSFDLVYYHKAAGGQWGAPHNFIMDAPGLAADNLNVSVYPNPATDMLLVQLSTVQQPVVFKLFDAYGRLIKEQSLVEANTTIMRGDIPCGLYFWQVENAEKPLGHGKVVFR